ncbi:glycosyltransferase family 8 protein [Mesorhizobium loti]|uniref:glycosyltransferase family 8 protein n=1 Tax=Rhizobium loti TaxID=381 RepID=UPI00047D963C|nr:glycosyltransferase family 8 protein [Mesorhizobium loti]
MREEVRPAFPNEGIAVVLSFDERYSPYAAALLASIVAHADVCRSYDILVFHQDISLTTQRRLGAAVTRRSNISLRFIEISEEDIGIILPVHLHFSRETYFRLWIPLILKHFSKVIYLDSDVVVLRDIAGLHEIELGGKPIGAVRDFLMLSFRRTNVLSPQAWGSATAENYVSNYLCLKDPDGYFQAGVLLFDLARIDRPAYDHCVRSILAERAYWFVDQDVLNILFNGRVAVIDPRWNVVSAVALETQLATEDAQVYGASVEDPFIVHYPGPLKPWHSINRPLGHHFWIWSRITSWYEQVLSEAIAPPRKVGRARRTVATFVRRLRNIGYLLFPFGDRRRQKRRLILQARRDRA